MNLIIRYTLLLVGISFMLVACNSEDSHDSLPVGPLKEGTPVTLSFTASVPHSASTRGVDNVDNLTLVVFDQNHRYLYKAEAQIGGIVDADNVDGETYLPDNVNEPIGNKLRKFTVTLLSSSEPRIIHFVANYNWTGFPKDYEIEGTDEGQIIPKLHTGRNDKTAYWQSFKFNTIELNTFHNTVFKFLRNQARFTLNVAPTANFTLTGYCLHNAPDKGTVAPFYSKTELVSNGSMYDDVLYNFPEEPTQSTIMADLQLSSIGDVHTNKGPLLTYEYRNTEAEKTKQMLLVVKGKFMGSSRDTYYKVDLTISLYDNNGNYMGSSLFDVIRNNNYTINISRVDQEGYSTYEEALTQPAGNNLFASVELKDFPSVSDGTYVLSVDNTNAVMVLPGLSTTQIGFSSARSTHDVKVFYKNKECKGSIDGNDYIDYANYNPENGVLYVSVKKIPTNEENTLTFNVIATPTENPSVHIQRTITLQLRPRYEFNAKLTEYNSQSNPQGEQVDLSFTIPGTLPENLFPYYVYIAADQLSPYVSSTVNDGLVVEKIGSRVFYRYTVKTKPGTSDAIRTLHFQRTTTEGSSVVVLVSDYYNSSNILLKNSSSASVSSTTEITGLLTFTGLSFTKPHMIPSDLRTKLSTSSSGVTATMVAAGYVKLTGLNTLPGTTPLTLTAELTEGGGIITCTKTLTVAEWKARLSDDTGSVDMDIAKLKLKGHISYLSRTASGYGAPKDVPTTAELTIVKENGSIPGNASMVITSAGMYEMNVTGIEHLKSPVAFRVEYKNNEFAPSLLVSYSQYALKLIDMPDIRLVLQMGM